MLRTSLVSVALLLAIACEPLEPHQRTGDLIALDAHITLLVVERGVVAVDASSGHELWRYQRPYRPGPDYARVPQTNVACVPGRTASSLLMVAFTDTIHALSLENGTRVWSAPLPVPRVCPVVTPDSSVVMWVPRRHGSGMLVKHGPDGKARWTHPNPDIGPIQRLSVDRTSGDVLARSSTHVLSVSPAGDTNWVAPLEDYGAGP